MGHNNMLRDIYSSLKVSKPSPIFCRGTDVDTLGLDEPLFERLFTSAAEPFLKGLRELFLNFWGAFILDPVAFS